MTETGNSFHAASSLRHTSSITLAGEEWRSSLSVVHYQMFSVGDSSGDRVGQGSNKITVHRGRSEHDVQLKVLRYLVRKWRLAGLIDETQLLVRNITTCVQNIVDPN